MQYENFAQIYDELMSGIDYEIWSQKIIRTLSHLGIKDGIICDLGCGTGNITLPLARAGYDMIGIDNSIQMLEIAKKKSIQENREDILFLCQDMREMELFGTVRAIVSVCDCMNYIRDVKDLADVFALAMNYLDYDGVFLFDFLTPTYYEEVLDQETFAHHWEAGSYIWENEYQREEGLNFCDLTLFLENEEGSFQRIFENHIQRSYQIVEIEEMLKAAHFQDIEFLKEDFKTPADEKTHRVTCLAMKRK